MCLSSAFTHSSRISVSMYVVQSSEPPISFTSNGNLLFVENVITVGRDTWV